MTLPYRIGFPPGFATGDPSLIAPRPPSFLSLHPVFSNPEYATFLEEWRSSVEWLTAWPAEALLCRSELHVSRQTMRRYLDLFHPVAVCPVFLILAFVRRRRV